jgi:hypothetical protein
MVETKKLKELKEELEYWKYYEAVNNMGKWSKKVRINKLEEQIDNLETLVGFAAQFYSGSDEKEKQIFTEGFVEAIRVMGSMESEEETNELENDTEQTIS